MIAAAAAPEVIRVGFFQMLNAFDPAIANRYYDFTDPHTNTEYKIQFYYLSQGMRAMAALENGELDVTSSGSSPLSLAASRGVAVKTISLIDIDQLSQGLVTRPMSPDGQPISSPLDLIGRAVSTPYGSTAHFNMLWALESFSLPYKDHGRKPVLCNRLKSSIDWGLSTDNPEDWQESTECSSEHVNLFHGSPEKTKHWWDAGLIDGAANWEPTFSYVKDRTAFTPGINLIETKSLSTWGKFTFNCIATTPAFAAKHPQLLVRIISIMNLLAMDYRHWSERVALSSALRQGSLGWGVDTPWVIDVIQVNIAPSNAQNKTAWMLQDAEENPTAAQVNYDTPARLGLNLVPSVHEQLNGEPGGDACRYMGCGTLGGINTMANAHVNFHFNAKLAREVVPVEVVDQRFLLEAERSNYLNLTLASLEKKEYEPLPAVPAVDDFCSSWAVQQVGESSTPSLISDYHGDAADTFEYPDATTCIWLLRPINGPFVLNFSFFSLEGGYDFLRLYRVGAGSLQVDALSGNLTQLQATLGHGDQNEYESQGLELQGAFTGQNLPIAVQSDAPMLIVFTSDFLANAGYRTQRDTGFRATAQQWQCAGVSDCSSGDGGGTCNLTTGMCECAPLHYGAQCGHHAHCVGTKRLTAATGSFSHGSAATYHNGADCRWRVEQDQGLAIELTFTRFSLEAGKDYLTITDEQSGVTLGRFTGDELPPVVVSTGSSVAVRLTSDAMAKRAGFVASYRTVAADCVGASVAGEQMCGGHGICDGSTRTCICAAGYFGHRCTSSRCLSGEEWRMTLTNTSATVRAHAVGAGGYGNEANCHWSIKPQAGSYDKLPAATVSTSRSSVAGAMTAQVQTAAIYGFAVTIDPSFLTEKSKFVGSEKDFLRISQVRPTYSILSDSLGIVASHVDANVSALVDANPVAAATETFASYEDSLLARPLSMIFGSRNEPTSELDVEWTTDFNDDRYAGFAFEYVSLYACPSYLSAITEGIWLECGGRTRGTCDLTSGKCYCHDSFTGSACQWTVASALTCPAGSYTDGAGECIECPMTYFSPMAQEKECTQCAKGEYTNKNGSSSCDQCSGMARVLEQCDGCPLGKHERVSGGIRECVECPPGMFQDDLGQSECKSCPKGQFTAEHASRRCETAKRNHFILHNAAREVKCPKMPLIPHLQGASCKDGRLTFKDHFWSSGLRISPSSKNGSEVWIREVLADNATTFWHCRGGCNVSAGDGSLQCLGGTSGVRCGICADLSPRGRRYYENTFTERMECKECAPLEHQILYALLLIFIIVGLLVAWQHLVVRIENYMRSHPSLAAVQFCGRYITVVFKQLVTFGQIVISIERVYAVRFPPYIRRLLQRFAFVNFSIFTRILACMHNWSKLHQLYLYLVVCLVVLAISLSGELSCSRDSRHTQVVKIALIVGYLLYTPASVTFFEFLQPPLQIESISYLKSDLSISTADAISEKAFHNGRAVALLMVVLFSIGLPLLYLRLLLPHSITITANRDRDDIHYLHFFYGEYKGSLWFWEIIECLRKVLIIGFAVCWGGSGEYDGDYGDLLQLIVSTIILVLYASLLAGCLPYREASDNALALLLSSALVLIFLAAIVFKVVASFEPHDTGNYSVTDLTADFEGALLCALVLVLLSGIICVVRQTFWAIATPKLRYAHNHDTVVLPPLEEDQQYDVFLSHAQDYGQDQVYAIKTRLESLFPSIQIFLDVDSLEDVHELPDLVRASRTFLLFLTRGCLSRHFVQLEVETAVESRSDIILVAETDSRHGAAPVEHHREKCPTNLADDLFPLSKADETANANEIADEVASAIANEIPGAGSANRMRELPPIPWVRQHDFREVAVKMIVQRLIGFQTDQPSRTSFVLAMPFSPSRLSRSDVPSADTDAQHAGNQQQQQQEDEQQHHQQRRRSMRRPSLHSRSRSASVSKAYLPVLELPGELSLQKVALPQIHKQLESKETDHSHASDQDHAFLPSSHFYLVNCADYCQKLQGLLHTHLEGSSVELAEAGALKRAMHDINGNSEAQKHHTMMRSATMRRLSQGLTPHTMIQMPAHAMLLPLSKGVLLNEQVREDIAVALQHGWKIVLLSIKDEEYGGHPFGENFAECPMALQKQGLFNDLAIDWWFDAQLSVVSAKSVGMRIAPKSHQAKSAVQKWGWLLSECSDRARSGKSSGSKKARRSGGRAAIHPASGAAGAEVAPTPEG